VRDDPLAVVLVHWNQPQRCAATIAAFTAQSHPVTLTIVDNASSPAAWDALRRELEGSDGEPELVRLERNVGFGPAANVGIRRWLDTGAGTWVGVAPHDALPDPDCVDLLLTAAGHRPRAGLVSADVGDGASPVVDRYFGGILRPGRPTAGWEPVHHPHGTLMLARRATLAEVGLFDERFFSYVEEADLGERVRRVGWEVGLVRGARVHNPHMSARSEVVDYLQERNTLLLVRKHYGRYATFIRFVTAVGQLVRGLLAPGTRREQFNARARLWALGDHLRGRYGPPPAGLAASR